MRRVVVTGLGAVTPLGVGVRHTWQRLINGECGIVSTRDRGAEFAALPSQVAGIVPEGTWAKGGWSTQEHVSPAEARQSARFAHYGLAAAAEALQDSGFPDGKGLDGDMTGVCLGSGIGNLQELYDSSVVYGQNKKYRKIHPLFVPRILINLGAGHISMRYGLKGPNHAVTTACTTGAHSIGDAMRFIQAGDADVMIAGGAESCIHPLAIGGFARSRSLVTEYNDTPAKSSRPFDRDRAGFVISEGAAIMILEDFQHARNRGAKIYAELSGYGCSADAYHLTAPHPEGLGALLAMKKALKQANIPPSKVDYINAHATSTSLGDAAENMAIQTLLLGEDGKTRPGDINVSSTKGAIGHLLGAAGAVEAVFGVLAISEVSELLAAGIGFDTLQNVLPPTINLQYVDEGFDCNYVPQEAQQYVVKTVLTNSFGFGGTNASLCFNEV